MADLQYVVFKLNTEEYGIDISCVHEIVQMQEITKVPQASALVEGIISLRGKIIPIVDLKKRFYGEKSEISENSRIIVVSAGEQLFGVIADEVSEVLRLNKEMVEPPPHLLTRTAGGAGIKGVGKVEERLLILVDLAETFTPGEIAQLDEAAS